MQSLLESIGAAAVPLHAPAAMRVDISANAAEGGQNGTR
jgi:hypothetical protein